MSLGKLLLLSCFGSMFTRCSVWPKPACVCSLWFGAACSVCDCHACRQMQISKHIQSRVRSLACTRGFNDDAVFLGVVCSSRLSSCFQELNVSTYPFISCSNFWSRYLLIVQLELLFFFCFSLWLCDSGRRSQSWHWACRNVPCEALFSDWLCFLYLLAGSVTGCS